MKKLLTAALVSISCALPAMAQSAVTVTPEIAENGYNDLNSAVTAILAAEGSEYVITLNQDQPSFTNTINPAGKNITIQGATPQTTVTLAARSGESSLRTFINLNPSATGSITLKDLTIDGSGLATNTTNLAMQQNGSLTIDNVRIKNFATTATNGIIRIHGTPTATSISDLVLENCSTPETDPYDIMLASTYTGLTLKGDCAYSIRVNNNNGCFNDGGITSGPLVIYTNHSTDTPIVIGSTDRSKFRLENASMMLAPQGEDLYTIAYAKVLLINDTENGKESKGFANLNGSSGAGNAAAETAEIIINEDIDYGGSTNLYGKTVTIMGANPAVTVNLTASVQLANANAENTHITVKDLIINGNYEGFSNYVAQASTNNSSVAFDNVTLSNISNAGTAMIRANKGVWSLNNVTFANCEMTSGAPLVLTNNSGCSISGDIKGLSLLVNNAGTTTIDAEGLSADSDPVSITLGGSYSHDNMLVTNCDNTSLFALTNNGWSLQSDNGGIKILEDKIVTGIEEVAAEAEGEAEYFDLRGMRVSADSLTPGLYICRKGGNASKTVIR